MNDNNGEPIYCWDDYNTQADPRNALLRESDIRSGLCASPTHTPATHYAMMRRQSERPVSTTQQPRQQATGLSTDTQQALQLAALLKLSQAPQSTGQNVHFHISNSFNQTDSHNRKYRYHQQQLEPREVRVKPSQIVGPLFAGFWAMSILVLLISGGANNGR